jgi:hypothetical protein
MNTHVIPINVAEIARTLVEAIHTAQHHMARPIPQPDANDPVSAAERQALRDLCALADVLNLPEGAWLLVPASTALLDVLAAFETEREDLENGNELEAVDEDGGNVDDEPHDGELDLGELDDSDREPDLGWTASGQGGGASDLEEGWSKLPVERDRPHLHNSPAYMADEAKRQLSRIKGEPDQGNLRPTSFDGRRT